MAFNFPASPAVDQVYSPGGGPTYKWNGTVWIPLNSGFSQQTFTAIAGQTTFTVASGYQSGLIDVFQNGVKLVIGVDYTATTGTTVVLAAPAVLGDTIQTVAYAAVSASNTYTKAEVDALLASNYAKQAGRGTFFAGPNGTASVPNLTNMKLPTNVFYDTDGWFNSANSRYTPKVAGLYYIECAVQIQTAAPSGLMSAVISSPALAGEREIAVGPAIYPWVTVSGQYHILLNGTTDYVEPWGRQSSGVNQTMCCFNFCGFLVRAT